MDIRCKGSKISPKTEEHRNTLRITPFYPAHKTPAQTASGFSVCLDGAKKLCTLFPNRPYAGFLSFSFFKGKQAREYCYILLLAIKLQLIQ